MKSSHAIARKLTFPFKHVKKYVGKQITCTTQTEQSLSNIKKNIVTHGYLTEQMTLEK